MLTVPMRGRRGIQNVQWPLLAPHEMLAQIVDHGQMEKMLIGGLDLRKFWECFFLDEVFNPLRNIMAETENGQPNLPVRLHGDEGRYYNLKSILIFSVGGVAHSNDPYETRGLITVLPSTRYVYAKRVVPGCVLSNGRRIKARTIKVNLTLKAVADFLAWSFGVAATGLWPAAPFVGVLTLRSTFFMYAISASLVRIACDLPDGLRLHTCNEMQMCDMSLCTNEAQIKNVFMRVGIKHDVLIV